MLPAVIELTVDERLDDEFLSVLTEPGEDDLIWWWDAEAAVLELVRECWELAEIGDARARGGFWF